MPEHNLRPVQLGLSLGTFLFVAYLACLALALIYLTADCTGLGCNSIQGLIGR